MADPAPPAPSAGAIRAIMRQAGPAGKGDAAGRRGGEADRRRPQDAARGRPQGVRRQRRAGPNRAPSGRNPLISLDRRKYKFPKISAREGVPPRPAGQAASRASAIRDAARRPIPAAAARRDKESRNRRRAVAAQARPQPVRGRRSTGRNRLSFGCNPLISHDRRKYKFSWIFRAAGAHPSRGVRARPAGQAASRASAIRDAARRPIPAAAARRDNESRNRRRAVAAQARPQPVRGRRSTGRNRLSFGCNPLILHDRRKYKFSWIFRAAGAHPSRGVRARGNLPNRGCRFKLRARDATPPPSIRQREKTPWPD